MSQQSGIHIHIHRWWAKAHFVWRQRQVSNRVIWHSVVVQCSVFTKVVSTLLFTTVVSTILFTTGAIFDEIFLWQVFWAAPHKVQIVPGLSQRTILALQNIPKYPSWTPLDLHNIYCNGHLAALYLSTLIQFDFFIWSALAAKFTF